MTPRESDRPMSRRTYMISAALLDSAVLSDERNDGSIATLFLAIEAVSSWAIENPDVDMTEMRPWAEWVAERGGE